MGHEIDNTEKAIRLGCGGLLGLLVGIFFFTSWMVRDGTNTTLFVITVIVFAVSFGYIALVRGDAFWSSAKDWLNKWWT